MVKLKGSTVREKIESSRRAGHDSWGVIQESLGKEGKMKWIWSLHSWYDHLGEIQPVILILLVTPALYSLVTPSFVVFLLGMIYTFTLVVTRMYYIHVVRKKAKDTT
jgi:hypothetical protein